MTADLDSSGTFDSGEDTAMLPFEVAIDDLSESTLNEVIRQFIQPEESAMSESVFQGKDRVVRRQISTGSLKLITDPGSESTVLMSSQDWRLLQAKIAAR